MRGLVDRHDAVDHGELVGGEPGRDDHVEAMGGGRGPVGGAAAARRGGGVSVGGSPGVPGAEPLDDAQAAGAVAAGAVATRAVAARAVAARAVEHRVVDVGVEVGPQQGGQAAHGPPPAVEPVHVAHQEPLLRNGPLRVENQPEPAGQPG